MRLVALQVLLQTEMTDFPTLSHTSSTEIPTLVLLLKLENATHQPPESPRIGHYR